MRVCSSEWKHKDGVERTGYKESLDRSCMCVCGESCKSSNTLNF